MKTQKQQQQL